MPTRAIMWPIFAQLFGYFLVSWPLKEVLDYYRISHPEA